MTCTRRPDSLWTKCRCPRCAGRNARLVKLNKAGMLRLPDPAVAVDRVRQWHAAGFTDEWIASACGVNPWQVHRIAGRTRRGLDCTLFHGTTRLILAADIRDGSDGFGPMLSVTRRLRALACIGHTQDMVAAETGISQGILSRIQNGKGVHIAARNWHALVGYYERHSMTPGPSVTARRNGSKNGWAPPLAWDDDSIDDPTAEPNVGDSSHVPNGGSGRPSAVVAEDVEFLLEHDAAVTTVAAAARLGMLPQSLKTALERAGRRDLRDRLTFNTQEAA